MLGPNARDYLGDKTMSSKNCDQQGEDHRALWERPAFRRLPTQYAEGGGLLHDEGNPTDPTCHNTGTGSHSCKNAVPCDIRLKHDIALLGRLDNGLGLYRFSYNGSDKAYVGVMAQEVQAIMPDAVVRGPDGYLNVLYENLGVKFQTYDRWIASGARIPLTARIW